ncbi:MAG TPA: WG repeat-containing protein [Chitinophagaceae bacterium]|nr:WG repeat-containing protein [Chitinophagaceae bacterium]
MKRLTTLLLTGVAIISLLPLPVWGQEQVLVPYRVGDKWGYSDLAGNLVIQPQYADALPFNKGHAAHYYLGDTSFYRDIWLINIDKKRGYVHRNGTEYFK